MAIYEKHNYKDPSFPIIFHFDSKDTNNDIFFPHWHENIEMLYFIEGQANITINQQHTIASKGDLVVINSEQFHNVKLVGESCKYYCIIINKTLYNDDNELFQTIINDKIITNYINLLIDELSNKKENYKEISKHIIASLFLNLKRSFKMTEEELFLNNTGHKKTELAKSTIKYIKSNYKQEISIDDICKYLGFTKCYLCHTFKEVTSQTIIDYINYVRCSHAQKLLLTGKYNVCESANMSGFNSMSYFSKIYKKFFGKLPSEEIRNSI